MMQDIHEDCVKTYRRALKNEKLHVSFFESDEVEIDKKVSWYLDGGRERNKLMEKRRP